MSGFKPRNGYTMRDCGIVIVDADLFARRLGAWLREPLAVLPTSDAQQKPLGASNAKHVTVQVSIDNAPVIPFVVAEMTLAFSAQGELAGCGKLLLMSASPANEQNPMHAFVEVDCCGTTNPTEWVITQRIVNVAVPRQDTSRPAIIGVKDLRYMYARATTLFALPTS